MAHIIIVLVFIFITWFTTGAAKALPSSPYNISSAHTRAQPQQLTIPNSAKLLYDFSSGLFIATYYIGNPPKKVRAFIDTGSDIIWTNTKSNYGFSCSTSTKVRCDDPMCQKLGNHKTCTDGSSPYTYFAKYLDRDTISGELKIDTFWFDSPSKGSSQQKVGPLYFGCSDTLSKGFGADGCLGLNRGKLSLPSQLSMMKRFSHCLGSGGSAGIIQFGPNAVISQNNFVSFPSAAANLENYFVNLEGINIGNIRLLIPAGTFTVTPDGQQGFMIDCGFTYTSLTQVAYTLFYNEMEKVVDGKAKLVKDPNVKDPLKLCFSGNTQVLQSLSLVTFHFSPTVQVKLKPEVIFIERKRGKIWYMTIDKPTNKDDKISVFGNFQMANLNIGYDLNKDISFAPVVDCSAKQN